MKPYQLVTLVTALLAQSSSSVPIAPSDDEGLRFVSKYPQHPTNLGYGDNYPKYWLNEAYNPADFPAPARVPFYPYPYSTAWKSQEAPQSPEDVQVKIVETTAPVVVEETIETAPKWVAPHGFPASKTPAKDAIQAFSAQYTDEESGLQLTEEEEEAAAVAAASDPLEAPLSKALAIDEVKINQEVEGTAKPTTLTKDTEGYSKTTTNAVTPAAIVEGPQDWSQFSYGLVQDSVLEPEVTVTEEKKPPKIDALGKILTLLGGGESAENWYDNVLQKRDGGWPEHIQAKADKMMKSAAAMQDRGASVMATEQQKKPEPKKDSAKADPKDSKPESKKDSKAEPKKGESKEAKAPPRKEQPIPVEDKADMQKDKKKMPGDAAKSSNKEKNHLPKNPSPAATEKKDAPVEEKPKAKAEKKKEEDPMMKDELPPSSGTMKKPKKPKQSRQGDEAVKPQDKPGKRGKKGKPARNSKNRPSQDNLPKQTRNGKDKAPKPDQIHMDDMNLAKRDAAAEPIRGQSNVKHFSNKDAPKPKAEECTEENPCTYHKQGGLGFKSSQLSNGPHGRVRPNINQDRPQKKKDRGANRKAVSTGFEDQILKKFTDDHMNDVFEEEGVDVDYLENDDMIEAISDKVAEYQNDKPADVEDEESTIAKRDVEEVVEIIDCPPPSQEQIAAIQNEFSGVEKRQVINRKTLACGPPVTIRKTLGDDAVATATAEPVYNFYPEVTPTVEPVYNFYPEGSPDHPDVYNFYPEVTPTAQPVYNFYPEGSPDHPDATPTVQPVYNFYPEGSPDHPDVYNFYPEVTPTAQPVYNFYPEGSPDHPDATPTVQPVYNFFPEGHPNYPDVYNFYPEHKGVASEAVAVAQLDKLPVNISGFVPTQVAPEVVVPQTQAPTATKPYTPYEEDDRFVMPAGFGLGQYADGQVQILAPGFGAPVDYQPWVDRAIVRGETVTLPGPTEFVTVFSPGPTGVVEVERIVSTGVEIPVEVPVKEFVEVPVSVEVPVYVTATATQVEKVFATETVKVPVQVTATATQIETVVETRIPEIKITPKTKEQINKVNVPGTEEVVVNKKVHGTVPVTKTILVCPECESVEGVCKCGTFDHPIAKVAGGSQIADVVVDEPLLTTVPLDKASKIEELTGKPVNGNIIAYSGDGTGFDAFAKDAEAIEAYLKSVLPEGILAQN